MTKPAKLDKSLDCIDYVIFPVALLAHGAKTTARVAYTYFIAWSKWSAYEIVNLGKNFFLESGRTIIHFLRAGVEVLSFIFNEISFYFIEIGKALLRMPMQGWKCAKAIAHVLSEARVLYPVELALLLGKEIFNGVKSSGKEGIKELYSFSKEGLEGLRPIIDINLDMLREFTGMGKASILYVKSSAEALPSALHEIIFAVKEILLLLISEILALLVSGAKETYRLGKGLPPTLQKVLSLPTDILLHFLAELYTLILAGGKEFILFSKSTLQKLEEGSKGTRENIKAFFYELFLIGKSMRRIPEIASGIYESSLEITHAPRSYLKTLFCDLFSLLTSGLEEIDKLVSSFFQNLETSLAFAKSQIQFFANELSTLLVSGAYQACFQGYRVLKSLLEMGAIGKDILFSILVEIGEMILSFAKEAWKIDRQLRKGAWSAFKTDVLYPLERILIPLRVEISKKVEFSRAKWRELNERIERALQRARWRFIHSGKNFS